MESAKQVFITRSTLVEVVIYFTVNSIEYVLFPKEIALVDFLVVL